MYGESLGIEQLTIGAQGRKYIKGRGNVEHIICHESAKLCFLLTSNDVLCVTNIQSFKLDPLEVPGDLWRRRVNKIRILALDRRIKTINELLRLCGPGVKLLPVKLEWYV